MTNKNEIILYKPNDSVQLEIMLENETVWLSLNQMSLLFDRYKSVISRYIQNIFKKEELFYSATVANFATVQNGQQNSVIVNFATTANGEKYGKGQ